jgi:hypothetical protein
MDFATEFYFGLMSLCCICCPPTTTLVITAIIFILSKTKIIDFSNKQILLFAVLFFIFAILATWLIVWYLTKDVYVM